MTTVKKVYPSPQQRQLLIQLVEADPQLRSGKFSSTFTRKDTEKRWKDISTAINALNGAHKTWEGWRKTWQDRKSNTKKKFALARRQANLTGGGPPPKPPSDEDYLILRTIPSTSLVGHIDSKESIVEFPELNLYKEVIFDKEGIEAEDSITPHQTEDNTQNRASKFDQSIERVDVEVPIIPHQTEEDKQNRPSRKFKNQQKCQMLGQSVEAVEKLTKYLKEKNEIKKTFYEQYIQVMKEQSNALNSIANALNARYSPYI